MKKILPACAVLLLLAGVSQPAMGQDEPTIVKDSIVFNAWTVNSYRKNFDIWSWLPQLQYRVNGPIASGSQMYVEYTIPGAAAVKFDCPTGDTQKGYWWKTECGGRGIPEEKAVTYVGPVSFTIKMRNELTGTNATLFSGKAQVAKVHSSEVGPKAINKWVYYVEHDWTLPMAYVFLEAVSVAGWNLPTFHVAFWVRGDQGNSIEPHLFYQGKEVGKQFLDGTEVGKAGCGSELEINTTHFVDEKAAPQKARWQRIGCTFYNVRGWDKTGEKSSGLFQPPHLLSANPGDYEFKALWKGRLARTLKFTVGPDAKFDNGIASAYKLGSERVIYPITVLGTEDGVWDRLAWKAGAFYGNPVPGFTAAAAAPAAPAKK